MWAQAGRMSNTKTHPVIHFEVLGHDAGALQRFYSEAFGWQLGPAEGPMEYTMVHLKEGGGIDGGIGKAPQCPGHVTFYVGVDAPGAAPELGLDHIRRSPREVGRVDLSVRRPAVDVREVLAEGTLDLVEGLVGDTWRQRGSSSTPDGKADPEAQLTVMNARAAALFAVAPDRRQQSGDQLYLDLDISLDNLPPGTRV